MLSRHLSAATFVAQMMALVGCGNVCWNGMNAVACPQPEPETAPPPKNSHAPSPARSVAIRETLPLSPPSTTVVTTDSAPPNVDPTTLPFLSSLRIHDFIRGENRVYWIKEIATEPPSYVLLEQDYSVAKGEILATGLRWPGRLALGNGYVYWSENDVISAIALKDRSRTQISRGLLGYSGCPISGLFPSDSNVFVVGMLTDGSAGAVARFAANGDSQTLLWRDPSIGQIADAVEDEDSIYVLGSDGSKTHIFAVPKQGGPHHRLYTASGHFTSFGRQLRVPTSLAVDSKHIYMGDTNGVIWRSDKAMKSIAALARGGWKEKQGITLPLRPLSLLVDSSHLYFTDESFGGVYAASFSANCPGGPIETSCGVSKISQTSADGRFEVSNRSNHGCVMQTPTAIWICSFFEQGQAVEVPKLL